MKKIVHISNFNLMRFKGCFINGMPVKISNGLTRNGYYVMNYPDRDLCRMFGYGHMNFLGKRRINRHLIDYCRAVKPDALFIGHADVIDVDTILEIKKIFPGLKILQWSCDWIVPGYADRNITALKKYLEAVDVLLITTGDAKLLKQFKTDKNIVGYLPNIADKSIETGEVFKQRSPLYDIMLATNTGKRQFCGQDEEIETVVDEANTKIPGLKWLLAGIKGAPGLNGYEYIEKLTQSAMGLNLSRLNDVYHYSSDRMVHIMANGGLAFIDRRTGFNDIFTEDEAAFYSERGEFFDKLRFYKENPEARMKTAEKGFIKIHHDFNDIVVTKYMADLLFGNKITEKPWQVLLK